jgi:hypothetical protein
MEDSATLAVKIPVTKVHLQSLHQELTAMALLLENVDVSTVDVQTITSITYSQRTCDFNCITWYHKLIG